jgi:cytochrome c1
MKQVYKQNDLILPHLNLPYPCPIRIVVTENRKGEGYISLFVGQRDWEWNRKTGKFVASGTVMCAGKKPKNIREVKHGKKKKS